MKWLILLLFPVIVFGQDTIPKPTPVKPVIHLEHTTRYKMYKTDNMYTFLKLDTATGTITQVQYSVGDNLQNEFSVQWKNLNLENMSVEQMDTLDWENTPFPNNRYILKRTENMYNFILLEQTDGRMWQVQWSMEEENRGIVYDYQNN